jgi:magnesium transporter
MNGRAPSPLAELGSRPLFGTAAAHATLEIPIGAASDLAGDVRRGLVGGTFDSVADVAVCDGTTLLGLVTIERLLAAPHDAPLGSIMDDTPPLVGPGTDQEVAAWRMVRQNESSMAVIDEDGRFAGLIPPQRMLTVLLEEHEEDLSRLSGVLHQTSQARQASEEPVARRLWHRLPWLMVGFVGAMLAAGIVGSFEHELAEDLTVAYFLPGVVYMADAVGTQTEAVVIRGLSVGVTIRKIVRREITTGLVIGSAIAAGFAPLGLVLWHDTDVVIAVAIALFVASSVATVVAMALPYLLARAGRDPAFGAGPLATVIQDLLSILVYFATVAWIMG